MKACIVNFRLGARFLEVAENESELAGLGMV